jgi:hypothetical protein
MASESHTRELTRAELFEQADTLARRANMTRAEAFSRLDAGEFRGTIFESKMAGIRFLLGADNEEPLAAE